MSEHFDHIIIGGGVIGLCTAYHLTKAGFKPLLIEQFNLPNTRGSSHGQSRLLRKSHIEESYAELCAHSYDEWKAIEEEGGRELMIMTGLLLLQDDYGKGLHASREAMERLNLPHEWIDGKQLKQRYPMIKYPETYSGILDKTASIILADKALDVLQRLVEKNGVQIRDGERVLSIKPGATVTIKTSKTSYTCSRLIVATGPWSKEVTDSLGLQLPLACIEGNHIFWRAPTTNHFVPGQVPIVYHELVYKNANPYTRGFFGLFPTYEYPGLLKTMPGRHIYWSAEDIGKYDPRTCPMVEDLIKMDNVDQGYRFFLLFPAYNNSTNIKIVTRGEPPPFYCHPDDRDRFSMQPMIDLVSDYISKHFPGVDTNPSIVEPCMYCLTPDKNGIVDRHPKFHNILIGTAFSGKGFMLAPLVGKVLTQLAMDHRPSVDMTAFAIGRFAKKSNL